MKITLDPGAQVPERAHTYDAGADLFAQECGMIPPFGGSMEFDTGVHVAIPESCAGFVKGRFGLAFKHRIVAHEGTVDHGYTGSIKVLLFNHGSEAYTVRRGVKIAQLVIQPVLLLPFEVVDKLEQTERSDGGFGSTGR